MNKSLWSHIRVRADLSGHTMDAFPLLPVQVSVDGVKNCHRVVCKQACPLHCIHHPLHWASSKCHKHCSVVCQQQKAPPQLLAMVDEQVDSLIMPYHYYNLLCIALQTDMIFLNTSLRFLSVYVYVDIPRRAVGACKFAHSPLHT